LGGEEHAKAFVSISLFYLEPQANSAQSRFWMARAKRSTPTNRATFFGTL
jgi:hypothetical protein